MVASCLGIEPMATMGLSGARVQLVLPDRALHLENSFRWLNDLEVGGTLKRHFGVSRREQEANFEKMESVRDKDFWWAILDEEKQHIGFISLHLDHWQLRSAQGRLFLGMREIWGRGYATDAVRVRTRFAFDQLGLHRVDGHTINPAMCRVYEKCGYQHEGTARQRFWRGGHWHDAQLYAILERDVLSHSST